MAEGGEPADRHQEMQARGEDHEDRDFGTDGERIIAAGQRQRRRQREQCDRGQPFQRCQRPPGMDGEAGRAARRRLALAEQAPGPHDQDRRHDEIHESQLEHGQEDDPVCVQEADGERSEECAAKTAQSAQHHHDECLDDDQLAHAWRNGTDRNRQGSSEPGKRRSEHEYPGEQTGRADTEGTRHLAIRRGGAHQQTPPRLFQEDPESARDENARGEDEQVVRRQRRSEHEHRAGKRTWRRRRLVDWPEDELHDVVEDEDEREREQQLKGHVRLVDTPQEDHFDHPADRGHQQGSHQERDPEVAAERAEYGVREIRAQHVEGAVSKVQHTQHAEDEREARRYEPQVHRLGEADETLEEKNASHRPRALTVTPLRVGTAACDGTRQWVRPAGPRARAWGTSGRV